MSETYDQAIIAALAAILAELEAQTVILAAL
jgi:hypothetical protein